jgi:hypothetical protein
MGLKIKATMEGCEIRVDAKTIKLSSILCSPSSRLPAVFNFKPVEFGFFRTPYR